jgi:hypothetical protein
MITDACMTLGRDSCHRDVAKALNMSVQQVSNVRYRATKVEPNAQFIRWEIDWAERLESEK